MTVALLTIEQKDSLVDQQYAPDSYFNPIQDKNGNYIISVEERDQCSIEWVKNCPEIDFEPIEVTLPI